MRWSGRAPYLTGEWLWEGTLKEHCHVQPIQCDRRNDRHRYRQEFVPCRRPRSARRDRAAAEMVARPSRGAARQHATVPGRDGSLCWRASPESEADRAQARCPADYIFRRLAAVRLMDGSAILLDGVRSFLVESSCCGSVTFY